MPGVGTSAGGRWRQCTKSSLTTWPHTCRSMACGTQGRAVAVGQRRQAAQVRPIGNQCGAPHMHEGCAWSTEGCTRGQTVRAAQLKSQDAGRWHASMAPARARTHPINPYIHARPAAASRCSARQRNTQAPRASARHRSSAGAGVKHMYSRCRRPTRTRLAGAGRTCDNGPCRTRGLRGESPVTVDINQRGVLCMGRGGWEAGHAASADLASCKVGRTLARAEPL